jgi:hypothetical protein
VRHRGCHADHDEWTKRSTVRASVNGGHHTPSSPSGSRRGSATSTATAPRHSLGQPRLRGAVRAGVSVRAAGRDTMEILAELRRRLTTTSRPSGEVVQNLRDCALAPEQRWDDHGQPQHTCPRHQCRCAGDGRTSLSPSRAPRNCFGRVLSTTTAGWRDRSGRPGAAIRAPFRYRRLLRGRGRRHIPSSRGGLHGRRGGLPTTCQSC